MTSLRNSGMDKPVRYISPGCAPTAAVRPYAASLSIMDSPDPLVIGLLANGFPDSELFMKSVGLALLQLLPQGTRTVLLNKGNASAPATSAQVDKLAAEVHAVVTAYGH